MHTDIKIYTLWSFVCKTHKRTPFVFLFGKKSSNFYLIRLTLQIRQNQFEPSTLFSGKDCAYCSGDVSSTGSTHWGETHAR